MEFAYIGDFFRYGEDERGPLFQYRFINLKVGCIFVAPGHTLAEATEEAMRAVKSYEGNCGVWLENGVYYVDRSKRVNTKKLALEIGRACAQISIYGWARGVLAYC